MLSDGDQVVLSRTKTGSLPPKSWVTAQSTRVDFVEEKRDINTWEPLFCVVLSGLFCSVLVWVFFMFCLRTFSLFLRLGSAV